MNVGGDAVADRLIDEPFGCLATMQMGDGHPGDHGRRRGGENLVAITEHQHQVRSQLGQGVGEADQAKPHGLGDADGGVGAEQHFDLAVDPEAIGRDGLDRHAELGREMHAGGDQLQVQRGRLADALHHPAQQTIFGAGAGDDADPFSWWSF